MMDTIRQALRRLVPALMPGLILLLMPQIVVAADAPGRIVCLAPSLTDAIYDLEAQDRLVGVTSFRPPRAGSKEIVGTLTELNLEKIIVLRPDLVLMTTDSNRKRDLQRLQALGLRVVVFDACRDFDAICESFLRLGRLLGRQDRAQPIVAAARRELEGLQADIAGQSPQRIFWQLGTDPLVTTGNDTFSGELIRLAGGVNIFGDLKARYPRINREQVLVRNPEVIIVVTEMDHFAGEAWQGVKEIEAARCGRIHTIAADLVCQPTPRGFMRGFRTLVGLLYPELS